MHIMLLFIIKKKYKNKKSLIVKSKNNTYCSHKTISSCTLVVNLTEESYPPACVTYQ